MKNRRLPAAAACGVALMLTAAAISRIEAEEADAAPARMSLAQARQSVDMLNDLYVNAVLLMHGTYVKDRGGVAAATVARQLFEAMAKKGWPETRWLAATDRPVNPANKPRDGFERDAAAALKQGRARYERVENGRLRVATLVRMVDRSCLACHTKDSVGDAVGGLSYTVHLTSR